MHDARKVSLALLLGSLTIGCTSSPKHIPPTKPVAPYTQPKVAVPTGATTTTTPSRNPMVNGVPANPPAPVVLTPTPGVSVPAMATPTLPTTTPVMPVSRESVLPAAPPSPPMPPDMTGSVMPPVAAPIMTPPGL